MPRKGLTMARIHEVMRLDTGRIVRSADRPGPGSEKKPGGRDTGIGERGANRSWNGLFSRTALDGRSGLGGGGPGDPGGS
ncbi:hypothetical protein LptCag_1773 [Leptospirillum ferriphilum]|jgi:hypothetical protein|uniref:Uncharacterized protein n=1 Tax=Leptospirillum ferriphilum TaxID=178606 RepID=A0A094X254_9BACT|nr:hypothetical protein LptCag_1773 [Leptospirillum ferriphilum]OOH70219.1 hypothetical protein BOX24_10915 [Leptospirillum ferriphilum]